MSQWPPNPQSCKVTVNYAEVTVVPQFSVRDSFRFFPTVEQYNTIRGKDGYWLCKIDWENPHGIVFVEQQSGMNW